ncbi:putative ABC transport system permease protein [Desulfurella multipotens]|uniref:Putative ABC transport system permease protein n=1 Tax=Desulfurella multipotens TaxID=79269 RepID=A0A1G6RTP0_9BACT|nr:ABC transporter permease [Desulfurella multipotens]SDD08002.1 putative ABC transport system permease protein [Desulfurella multipotens]
MKGLLKIALKLLTNDRGKFFTLVLGITFAVFLMNQMTSMFAGIIRKSTSNVININAKMWVMDPSVENDMNSIPMPNYVLDYVRSIKGVAMAVPIYFGSGLAKLANGKYQSVSIIGLDDTILFGRPPIIKGNLNKIYNSDAFIGVKDSDYKKIGSPGIGSILSINDHRAIIVALANTTSGGLFGIPTLYTTYTRATRDLPQTRYSISYILINPKSSKDIPYIQKQVKKLSYKALTQKQFQKTIENFYEYKTGMGISIMMMTLISFIVGLSIAGQTFYAFVLENLEKFGALKAIGAKKYELVSIILFQVSVTSFIGYGFGIMISSLVIAISKANIQNYAAVVTYKNMLIAFLMVLAIAGFSSYIGIRKVLKIEPFDVFRG